MVGNTQTPSKLSCVDELDCGSFFGQIDDLIDIPSDDIDAVADETKNYGGSDDLSDALYVPDDDIGQLDMLTSAVEDSGFLTVNDSVNKNLSRSAIWFRFRTSSPISVLNSSGDHQKPASSCREEANVPPRKRGRPREKWSSPISVLDSSGDQKPTSSCSMEANVAPSKRECSSLSSVLDSSGDQKPASPCIVEANVALGRRGRPPCKKFCPCCYFPRPRSEMQRTNSEQKKIKKKKKRMEVMNAEPGQQQQQGVRKCVHCEATKTPQWRAGPMGANTLCNACGIMQVKLGRLLPEYRPANSPTFVPSLHSNVHKMVLQMRTNTNATTNDGDLQVKNAHSPELLIPNLNSNLAMDRCVR